MVVHLLSRRMMVAGLSLVLCHFLLRLDASLDFLLVSTGSPASSTRFHKKLALVLAKHNNKGNDIKTKKHNLISINQSNELSTNTGQQDACNNLMI